MSNNDSIAILPQASPELKQRSEELEARIRSIILAGGPIPFPRYMEMALYEPELGYYTAGLKKFGKHGDFVTAPELGSVFAQCLAAQIRQIATVITDYNILEVGAGSGKMAVDVLAELKDELPNRYWILERSPELKHRQRDAIRAAHPELLNIVEWLDEPPVTAWNGVIIANEVVDALAVERFRIEQGYAQQAMVGTIDDKLSWTFADAPHDLRAAVQHLNAYLGAEFPDGYCSEISLKLSSWLQGLTDTLKQGYVLLIDYGYARRDYYSPERVDGTLICHYQHRAHNNPFYQPGLQDLTAFVDFTALAEAADASELECAGYTNQAMFLLGCGLERVLAGLEQLPDRERLQLAAEVKQLTLPDEMGEKFQVMALSRDIQMDLCGFELLDLRYRL
ncbi:MAG: SAM-dependent MidA family methyltransferase [Lysobacterales bacterium]|jgi:SAM-dependent MidA family methyltransferase